MKKITLLPLALVAIFAAVLLNSCEQDLSKIETKPAESVLQVMKSFSDIILVVDDGLMPDSAGSGMRITEKIYTETITGDFPNKLITWDFGTEGDYQGVIFILLSDEYVNPGAVASVTFNEFKYKGKPVDGMVTFENLGKNQSDMDEYSFELMSAKVGTNELTAGWKLQRTEGGLTPEQTDDIFTITQLDQVPAEGVTEDGELFTLSIIEGLVLDLTCEHIIIKGIFELITSSDTFKADFGDGDCNNMVTVTNNTIKADIYF